MRKLVLAVAVVVAASLTVVAAVAIAHGGNGGGHRAHLNGYQEVVGPGSISTTGSGRFELRIRDDVIHFRLRYSQMEGAVSQAHIHFAQRHVGGGVIAFLCGGGGEDPCTSPNGDIDGTITPAEIIGPSAQGIEPGSFDEAVRAIRAGATYANVHSTPRWPNGEIRGQIGHGKGHGRDR
jgi:hypothetical protein